LIAGPPVHHLSASGGDVRATVSYVQARRWSWYSRLAVVRDGRRVLDVRVRPYPRETTNEPQSVAVRDLDGDGEPEILVDLWTGGAHCCLWTRIYSWNGETYTSVGTVWGDLDYRLEDLGDGGLDLVTGDDRFAYAFSSFAASGFPLRILRYRAGRLADVTAAHRPLVARDAARQWGYYRAARRRHDEVEGVLAAWAADESLLGKGTAALDWLRAHRLEPKGLARFLRRLGYRA
jgi:hypothetical protein